MAQKTKKTLCIEKHKVTFETEIPEKVVKALERLIKDVRIQRPIHKPV